MVKALSRRSFLKRTSLAAAGAVGFPYLVRPSALGLNRAVAPSNRLLMAQIGCGSMGSGNMDSFLNLGSHVQFVAVCDVDGRHLDSARNRVNNHYNNSDCRTYKDFREMLDREQLDVVSHAVPDHWHALVSVACAKKGIDIYGEKPLARTIGEGRAICDTVKRHGVIWQTGSWQRSVGNFRRAAELVINGRIGKVEYVEVGLPNGSRGRQARLLSVPDYLDWDMWLGPAPWRPYQDFGRGDCHWDWRWILDYSGGQLTDWAGHHVDVAHWGLGLDYAGPVEVEGTGEYADDGIWDVPYAYEFVCTYADGLKMRVANSAKQPHGMGTCWYGDRGWIHVSRGGLSASDPAILQERIGPEEIQLYKSDHHQRNFVECVRTRQDAIAPAEIAHRSITVGFLGEIAMLLGRKLRWDPKTEQFVNDSQANRYLRRAYRSPWML
ncbi:MAG TPA: twin-arginine translocation signal domain-containing protein [Phycisphaerales bacterium]|nr:twin-arginine translocation signal domain-containing protein [Phycisphaerales bacterium]